MHAVLRHRVADHALRDVDTVFVAVGGGRARVGEPAHELATTDGLEYVHGPDDVDVRGADWILTRKRDEHRGEVEDVRDARVIEDALEGLLGYVSTDELMRSSSSGSMTSSSR